jgi:BCD family chlorophyll transporter-like MFS transporter
MSFTWLQIIRLGLVQAALGAVVVLTTSTLNRVMVVELALPALLPGVLVALHYLVQMARPRMGHGSDQCGRRTPWILGGMAVLATGGLLASAATAWMGHVRVPGMALAFVAFVLIGLGVSAAGTNLLALLAKRVDDARRAPAATVVWLMMIFGFALTAGVSGALLDPYTPERLVAVSSGVSALAMLVSVLALRGLETRGAAILPEGVTASRAAVPFRDALAQTWADPAARRFTVFVFVSMLAYNSQDLILEPFAGLVFGYSPGQSTQLSGLQHAGVLVGMLAVALCSARGPAWLRSLRAWTVGGCLGSALALVGLVVGGLVGPQWPLRPTVFAMGVANGAFSIAAIASMMQLASEGGGSREGLRIGLWGAAQALAFGFGGLAGAAASDLARWLIGTPGLAYAMVFAAEALLFVMAAQLALRACGPQRDRGAGRAVDRDAPSRAPQFGRG